MKLAIRTPNWLGDAVMALPALEAVRQALPEAHLTVVSRAGVADLFRVSGLCDAVVAVPGPKGAGGWKAVLEAAGELRAEQQKTGRFDAGLILPNSFESALSFRLAGIRNCWGYARDGRGWLLRRAVAPPKKEEIPRHEVYYYLELLRRLGLIPALPEEAVPTLRLREETLARGRALLAEQGLEGTVIAMAPGAANSRAKQWPPERFVAAVRAMAADAASAWQGAGVAIFGTPQERELAEGIASELAASGVAAKSLAGKTSLADFVAAIACCQVLVTNDSGGMHVAYAAGVPTVAVFGPTIPEETGPLGAHTRIVREPVECSPCMLKDCPIDHRCMTRVSPERVAQEAAALVQLR